jgi:tetratricopeptide (TPR) repeat protein
MRKILISLSLYISFLFSLGSMTDEEWLENFIYYENGYLIVTSRDISVVIVNEEETLTRQSKKTLTSENITDSEIMENISLYYPRNLEQAYKELTKTLDDIKNKSRILDDIEFYNLVYESCIYDKTVQKTNDLAYFYSKQKNINYDVLIQVYNDILSLYPNRTVAYLNLADAYNGINNKEKAKENYEKYINLMKQDNKEAKIPKRVLEYK